MSVSRQPRKFNNSSTRTTERPLLVKLLLLLPPALTKPIPINPPDNPTTPVVPLLHSITPIRLQLLRPHRTDTANLLQGTPLMLLHPPLPRLHSLLPLNPFRRRRPFQEEEQASTLAFSHFFNRPRLSSSQALRPMHTLSSTLPVGSARSARLAKGRPMLDGEILEQTSPLLLLLLAMCLNCWLYWSVGRFLTLVPGRHANFGLSFSLSLSRRTSLASSLFSCLDDSLVLPQ